MKKWLAIFLSVVIVAVIVVSTFAAIELYVPSVAVANKKPFYVGVTYCGSSLLEAEQLVDKVKSYTNLFVVQSGPLMSNLTVMEQICDYAVNSGLNIIVYYAHNGDAANTCDSFLAIAQTRWGSHFLGLYYNDEPGGKMIDSSVNLYDNTTGASIDKTEDGTIYESLNNVENTEIEFFTSGEIILSNAQSFLDYSSESNTTTYFTNGTISLSTMNWLSTGENMESLWYQPNGNVQDENGSAVTNAGTISQFEPYQQLWDSRPLQTYAEAANVYVGTQQNILGSIGNQSDVKLFTSDYGLDWFDYQAGYDVVFGQLGWNQSVTQDIALVRGAADMQGKSWGTMITWASLTAPYLQSGDQMYNAMRQSYESGAEYVVVFNYAGQTSGTSLNGTVDNSGSGLLQDPQFAAIQKFWTDVVENPKETNNVKAQDALVLPNDYGWGMRNPTDNIWGLWQADNSSQQVWSALQASLAKYGSKLDIVYNDPAYPTSGRYQEVYYWNQTI